jgi:cytochrome o ubiquinol oxidase operon protein cyoD
MNNTDFNRLASKYVLGFGAALVLSVLSYLMVTGGWFASSVLTMAVLLLLATIQLVIQLVCFLHLGFGGRSRGRTLTLTFTIVMMLVIVIGSIWIMQNLDYRMGMSGDDMNHYMQAQNKKGF